MSATYGKIFKVTIFGESHSDAIGVIVDGVPSGLEIDYDFIKREMARRAPGQNSLSTPRKEDDLFEIKSGVFENRACGTPICAVINNTNTRALDYHPEILRPSHADFSGKMRYNGFNDYRGGGHFSGRLTAPLVFAGAIAKQILAKEKIEIFAHIKNIGKIYDETIDIVNPDISTLCELKCKTIPVLDEAKAELMKKEILSLKRAGNSVGGSIEAVICGVNAGIGSPFFDSVESRISSMLFSVPAVKAVEFGIGTKFSELYGNEANDSFYIDNSEVKTKTNNNGGINGGITNGMPIAVTACIKPTPSILMEQETVNIDEMKEVIYKNGGRHDPCIVIRAVPVIESALAISMADMLLEAKTYA